LSDECDLMRLQNLTSSKPATQLALFLSRHAPPWMGYGIARSAAAIIARQKPEIYWTVRSNLQQIVGFSVDDGALHAKTRQVFAHAGQTYYDFFRTVGQPPEVLAKAVRIPEQVIECMRSETAQGRGVLLLGIHTSNFDLSILAVGAQGLSIQALSLADPGAGFRVMNRLRASADFELTPITPESLRMAIRRLRNGGIVVTGVDRPIPEDRELIEFFGRPAYLPVGPTRLALMTGATVLVGGCSYNPDERYRLEYTGPVEMVRTGDRRQDILINARRIAAIVEEHIRARPEQWLMFHPIWPEPKV
jgi:lauroyl/myristoyl acyltransferase